MKNSSFPVLVGGGIVLAVVATVIFTLMKVGDNRGYSPEQPIPFSHARHAGEFKIPCQYCHSAAGKSRHATVPSMDTCMNCHQVVKPESPHIQKLKKLYEDGKSFEWVKVHDLPDHVLFNHQRHIAQGVPCETCHGKIQDMARITQEMQLNMGFCVNCHRERGAPVTCETCHQ